MPPRFRKALQWLLLVAGWLLAGAALAAEFTLDSLRSTIPQMAVLLERGDARGFIEQYVHPEGLQRMQAEPGEMDKAIARFKEKSGLLLECLAQTGQAEPQLDGARKVVEFEMEEAPGGYLRFYFIDGRWYIK